MSGKRAITGLEEGERRLLRRFQRRSALVAGILTAGTFVICAGAVLAVVVTSQQRDDATLLRRAVVTADDVDDPPAGIWLVITNDSRVDASGDMPRGLPLLGTLRTVQADGTTRVQDVRTADGEFRVLTQVVPRDGAGRRVVQGALSLRFEHRERARLMLALAVAGGIALVSAGAVAAVLGRRSVQGLVVALARQRRFVADASHELRTPLAVISTRTQLAAARATAGPAAGDLAALQADVGRLQDILEDLLEAAEPGTGEVTDRGDAVEVARHAVEDLTAVAGEAGVTLDLRLPADPAPVTAPARTLHRALTALIDNALRHTPSGGTVRVTVDTTTRRRGRVVTLEVADTGPGIDPAVQDRLFTPRGRGHDTSPGRRRYGLGLALVADAVHRAGGHIDVRSDDKGARFTLTLPAAPDTLER